MSQMNSNMFHIPRDPRTPAISTQGAHVTALPLHLIALIISYLDDVTDLARVCRTSRVLNYMTLPQLYKSVTLVSRDAGYNETTDNGRYGSASPFSTGLNTLVTRNVSNLVRSIHLDGQWKQDVATCQLSDDTVMLNIAVRAALDRCINLESLRWDLNTRPLQTVYGGLASLRHLESLRLRFPSTRTPIKPQEIPPLPNLRSFTMTDYDPLCFPDDISTLLLHATQLAHFKLHFSPRMREAGEPSVQVAHFFRKMINAKRKLKTRTIALYNLYADSATAETEACFDFSQLEDATFINTFGIDETGTLADLHASENRAQTFDASWRNPPKGLLNSLRASRHDRLHRAHAHAISQMTKLERLYLVNARPGRTPSTSTTPANGPTPTSNGSHTSSHSSTSSPSNTNQALRDIYLNTICLIGPGLKHLIFPARWPLPPPLIGRLFRSCPHLTQLSMSMDCSSFEGMRLLVPFLAELWAFRVLVPENGDPELREKFERLVARDKHEEMMPRELGKEGDFPKLRYIGIGWRNWEVGGFTTGDEEDPGGEEKLNGTTPGTGDEGEEQHQEQRQRLRKIWPVDADAVKEIEIWKMDSLDVV